MAKATGKDHAEINLDIWGDDDWLDLTPPAQHLYFVLWTSPQLSYCGTGEWHPGRISCKARGWTPAAVEMAGAELSRELFLVIDTATEEFILRSWMKHDGIWKKPNMAVSMANARAALASRTLRGVVVHEVAKIKARNIAEAKESVEVSVSSSWQRDAVVQLLSQKPVDPSTLERFTPRLTPPPTPLLTPVVTPPLTVNGGVGVNPPSDPTPTPSPAPFSYSNSKKGYVTGEREESAGQPSNTPRPPDRCQAHTNAERPPACGACATARRTAEAWDEARAAARAKARGAHLKEIAECPDCDERGWVDTETGVKRCPNHVWETTNA